MADRKNSDIFTFAKYVLCTSYRHPADRQNKKGRGVAILDLAHLGQFFSGWNIENAAADRHQIWWFLPKYCWAELVAWFLGHAIRYNQFYKRI